MAVSSAAIALPAFPGAKGFGSNTPGGRGGDHHRGNQFRQHRPRQTHRK